MISATCEIRFKDGRLPNLSGLAQHILDIRIGARLRGVEATVDGRLEPRGGEIVLITDASEALLLAPLKQKVQVRYDLKQRKKRPESKTSQERNAYTRLVAEFDRHQYPARPELRARITGPLEMLASQSGPVQMQVRVFQINPPE